MSKRIGTFCCKFCISSRCARLKVKSINGAYSATICEVSKQRQFSHSIVVNPSITMGKNKNRKNKENHTQKSPQSPNQSSKSEVDASSGNEVEKQSGIISSVLGLISSATSAITGSAKTEEEPQAKVDPVSDTVEEKEPEKDMGKRKIEEREDENETNEENAKSPVEKRQKSERDYEGIDEDVVEIMKKMEDMSSKQKKKYKAKLKADDEALYNRYIEANSRRPDGSVSPKKRVQSVEKEEESVSPVKGKDSPTKAPVTLKRDTPLLTTDEADREQEASAKQVDEAPDNWEDEAGEQADVPPTAEAAKKSEVEEYEKELQATSNELPKDHNKVSFGFKGFKKEAKDSNWNKDNGGGWTESNKKKAPKQDKNEQRGRNEGHEGGAREKEAPASKKSKNKKKGKIYPPGHPNYVPPQEHEPRQYSAGGSGSQSKAWELQVIKRDDGSIILEEIKGDLFYAPDYCSLAHCVSADFHMGKGIAVHFKKMFGGVGELRSFNARTGEMAFLRRQERFIYYLVTKAEYFKKPSMKTLESSLAHMREHCLQNRVQFIAMPAIGCGLDKLDWDNVRDLLVRMFRDTPVQITVYMV